MPSVSEVVSLYVPDVAEVFLYVSLFSCDSLHGVTAFGRCLSRRLERDLSLDASNRGSGFDLWRCLDLRYNTSSFACRYFLGFTLQCLNLESPFSSI